MPKPIIRDMQPDDEYFVSTCSHVNESEEQDACGVRRVALFRKLKPHGLRIKVALLHEEHAGFAYGIPIEHASWGALGKNLMSVPCLYVLGKATGRGVARRLLEVIEWDARAAGLLGLTVTAYRALHGADWFMPAAYFERQGFEAVDERGSEILLWKPFTPGAQASRFLQSSYCFVPKAGKVVVDLFWNGLCQTSSIEAERVREVCGEFGDAVVLNEYCAEDREILRCHQIPRGILVNGVEIGWGYEAPKDGIRTAIERAMSGST
ncbi:hypothetical protein KJ567_04275 [Candidatus Bipolaricaulota bacterium]|nr:hypothetical protein [Candidatus Bipolaricaulota bacterium]